jgi:hypothetical protein
VEGCGVGWRLVKESGQATLEFGVVLFTFFAPLVFFSVALDDEDDGIFDDDDDDDNEADAGLLVSRRSAMMLRSSACVCDYNIL